VQPDPPLLSTRWSFVQQSLQQLRYIWHNVRVPFFFADEREMLAYNLIPPVEA
jgi:hypothetical protein